MHQEYNVHSGVVLGGWFWKCWVGSSLVDKHSVVAHKLSYVWEPGNKTTPKSAQNWRPKRPKKCMASFKYYKLFMYNILIWYDMAHITTVTSVKLLHDLKLTKHLLCTGYLSLGEVTYISRVWQWCVSSKCTCVYCIVITQFQLAMLNNPSASCYFVASKPVGPFL